MTSFLNARGRVATAHGAAAVRRGRALTRLLALLTLASGLLLGGIASPANAVQYSGGSGQPGSISFYKAEGFHVNGCAATASYCPRARLRIPGPLVSRSPNGTAAQQVTAYYDIFFYNDATGAWTKANAQPQVRSKAISQQVALDDFTWNLSANEHWHVQITFVWTVRSTGLELARRTASYNQAADYRCNSSYTCSTGPGYLYLG